ARGCTRLHEVARGCTRLHFLIYLLQIYLFLLTFPNSINAQTPAYQYADSMMSTSQGIKMYGIYMEEAVRVEDTTEAGMAAYSELHTMYYFIDKYYREHGWPRSTDTGIVRDMCYNADFSLSDQNDDHLTGFQLYDGSNDRISDLSHCPTLQYWLPLPEESRPTVSEEIDSEYRFNLNPNDNGALSFVFYSDLSVNNKGWKAEITCENRLGVKANEIPNVRLYPNPTDGNLFLAVPKGAQYTVTLFDVQGKKLVTKQFNSELFSLNMDQLPSGVYMVRINTADKSMTRQVILNN
ncbi:MAG TPA: T9SS type A sorting domain-containing protein, partial [Saprospiraceae bacterium]|nr:T9SS type A sorting domain-containing protein [Saprospiraceae bacterium]